MSADVDPYLIRQLSSEVDSRNLIADALTRTCSVEQAVYVVHEPHAFWENVVGS